MIDAADFIIEHTKGVTQDEFVKDKLLYGAMIYYTMIIGEAAYKLSKEFTSTFTEVEWADIAAMRHHLVHGYYQVDSNVVWNIIRHDIIPLREQVAAYIMNVDWESWAS